MHTNEALKLQSKKVKKKDLKNIVYFKHLEPHIYLYINI
jgi:hypothetical protein